MHRLKYLPLTEKIKIIVWAEEQDDVDTVEFFYNHVSVAKIIDSLKETKIKYYRLHEKNMMPPAGMTLSDGTVFQYYDNLDEFKKAVGMDV